MGINDSEAEFENVSRAPIISNTSQELVWGLMIVIQNLKV